MIVGLLQDFPGYTLSSLLEEDAELIRLRSIVAMGRREEDDTHGRLPAGL